MTTPKLLMPELSVGQAGKELTHNQALAILDQLTQATVVDKDLAAPPGSPANGAMYIPAASATGAWSGQSGKLAVWLTSVAAWTFINPADGWSVWVADEALRYERKAGAWIDQRAVLGVGPGNSPTFTALTLSNGQIAFPATQVPSADANTLDDYEEGTWTPTLTFSVPGDLSVTYSTRTASYTKIGRIVSVNMQIITSSFTWTTAAGTALLTGLPFASNSLSRGSTGMQWSGITKAGYTDVAAAVAGSASQFQFYAAASGLAFASVVAGDMPSGGSINWTISYTYFV